MRREERTERGGEREERDETGEMRDERAGTGAPCCHCHASGPAGVTELGEELIERVGFRVGAATATAAATVAMPATRGLRSFTFQLNLSRV